MAQYAMPDGGLGSQFGYNPTFAPQQPHQMQFGSENFSRDQQHPNNNASGILDPNDVHKLSGFFSNPGVTDNMDFGFDNMVGDGTNDVKPSLVDLHDPSAVFATNNFPYDADSQAQSHSNGDSQRPSMSNQVVGVQDSHEQSSEPDEDEDTKAAVEGLVGMSANRPDSGAANFGDANGGFGPGAAWGGLSMHEPPFLKSNMNIPGNMFATRDQMGGMYAQAGPFGYYTGSGSYQVQAGYPGIHMQQQAHAGHQRGYPQSPANMHASAFTNLPSTEPRSAHLPNSGFPNLYNQSTYNSTRIPIPRYGSDDNFDKDRYRTPNNYTPPDEKATNLNHVPFAQEASANARTPFVQPGLPVRAPSRQSQGYPSQPPTPLYHNNTHNPNYFGGLPHTPNGTSTPYGGYGMAPFNGSALPNAQTGAHPNYSQNMHMNAGAGMNRQAGDESDDSSSGEADSDNESPEPQAQPSRKRRKSDHEQRDEDYEPPSGSKRRMQQSARDESADDEYGRRTSVTGSKRARAPAAHRATSSYAAAPTPPIRLPPAPPTSSRSRRDSSKRLSGSTINRAPLTDEQRRMNHIKSEKNRRDLIKTNYTELNNVIPALKGGKSGLSKSEVLREIVDFIEELEAGNLRMMDEVAKFVRADK